MTLVCLVYTAQLFPSSERKVVPGPEKASCPGIAPSRPSETQHTLKVEVLWGPHGFLQNRPRPGSGPRVTPADAERSSGPVASVSSPARRCVCGAPTGGSVLFLALGPCFTDGALPGARGPPARGGSATFSSPQALPRSPRSPSGWLP